MQNVTYLVVFCKSQIRRFSFLKYTPNSMCEQRGVFTLCKKANVEPLAKRRKMLCYNFVKKEIKSKDSLFVKAQRTVTRRGGKDLLFVPQAKSESHFKSPLVYLARLFNSKS